MWVWDPLFPSLAVTWPQGGSVSGHLVVPDQWVHEWARLVDPVATPSAIFFAGNQGRVFVYSMHSLDWLEPIGVATGGGGGGGVGAMVAPNVSPNLPVYLGSVLVVVGTGVNTSVVSISVSSSGSGSGWEVDWEVEEYPGVGGDVEGVGHVYGLPQVVLVEVGGGGGVLVWDLEEERWVDAVSGGGGGSGLVFSRDGGAGVDAVVMERGGVVALLPREGRPDFVALPLMENVTTTTTGTGSGFCPIAEVRMRLEPGKGVEELIEVTRTLGVPSPNTVPSVVYLDLGQSIRVGVELRLDASVGWTGREVFMGVSTRSGSGSGGSGPVVVADVRHSLTQDVAEGMAGQIEYGIEVELGDVSEDGSGALATYGAGVDLVLTEVQMYLDPDGRDPWECDAVFPPSGVAFSILSGCPPGKSLNLDVGATFPRDEGCDPEDDVLCLFFESEFRPVLNVRDAVAGTEEAYVGRLEFLVVGGGVTQASVRRFSPEEVFDYNLHSATMWTFESSGSGVSSDDPIISSSSPGINFICSGDSPCADIWPTFPNSPEYFAIIRISTRNVQTGSYCGLETEFLLRLHGLPMNFSQSITFVSSAFALCIIPLIAVYLCRARSRDGEGEEGGAGGGGRMRGYPSRRDLFG